MKYDRSFFDQGIDRRGTRCEKWDDPAFCQPGDLPMWVADWDFRCAEPIVDALRSRAEHGCYGYSCADARDQSAFCGYWQRRHGVTIRPEDTCMLPCVVTGLRQAVLTFTEPGDGVVILTPLYAPFYDAISRSGRVICSVPMTRDENARYQIDFEGIKAALKDGARMILFCNPHNPVSRAWRKEELDRLSALAEEFDVLLVSDEIHADFVYSPLTFHSMLDVPAAKDRVIAFAAASKTFNVPGLQQAMAVSRNADLLRRLKEHMDMQGITSGNAFALPATQAAYTQCDDWLDGMLRYLEESREILAGELPALLPDSVLTPIDATALCWIDLRAYDVNSDSIDQKLRAEHLILNRGTVFGAENGNGFMRLNFACPHASLREGLARMARAMKQ